MACESPWAAGIDFALVRLVQHESESEPTVNWAAPIPPLEQLLATILSQDALPDAKTRAQVQRLLAQISRLSLLTDLPQAELQRLSGADSRSIRRLHAAFQFRRLPPDGQASVCEVFSTSKEVFCYFQS